MVPGARPWQDTGKYIRPAFPGLPTRPQASGLLIFPCVLITVNTRHPATLPTGLTALPTLQSLREAPAGGHQESPAPVPVLSCDSPSPQTRSAYCVQGLVWSSPLAHHVAAVVPTHRSQVGPL